MGRNAFVQVSAIKIHNNEYYINNKCRTNGNNDVFLSLFLINNLK
jgi:hypothetical protein